MKITEVDLSGNGYCHCYFLHLQLGSFGSNATNLQETTTGVTDSTAVVYDSTAVVAVDSTGTTLVATKESIMVTLPNGKTLNAYKGGIEDQIVAFLNSDEYKNADEAALKDRWFNFDNLNFEFGTTKLTPESQAQLDNLKLILVAYPDAKVKIGAYTDKKGDDAGNKALSQKELML
ncbi:OmpA family protein [Kaistella anthropi]|nr:OmpA family protein [Kaistella anthropi]